MITTTKIATSNNSISVNPVHSNNGVSHCAIIFYFILSTPRGLQGVLGVGLMKQSIEILRDHLATLRY